MRRVSAICTRPAGHGKAAGDRPLRRARQLLQLQRRRGGDAAADRAVNGTGIGVDAVDAPRHRALLGPQPQPVGDVDAPDHEHVPVLLDLTDGLRRQVALAGRYPARLQRAPEGPGQSAGGRRDEVVEGRGVRLVDLRVDAVVRRDLGVDAEGGSIPTRLAGTERAPQRPSVASLRSGGRRQVSARRA